MRSMASGRERQAGFTLLELLISITILSLLLVALSGGVHFAGRAWRAQEEQAGRLGDINAVQTVLRHMLASAQSFQGDSKGLKFVGRMPAALARGGLYDIGLFWQGDKLMLSWRPHFKGASADLQEEETVLLNGVLGVDISYYLGDQGWQKLIKDQAKPVELIGIRAGLSDGRPWPALVVPPAINVSSKQKS